MLCPDLFLPQKSENFEKEFLNKREMMGASFMYWPCEQYSVQGIQFLFRFSK